MSQQIPLFASIPHSGEKVPVLTPWLENLPEPTLMADVDRYVDLLYQDTLTNLKIPFEKTEWHRYAVDLNRIPSDIDEGSVIGAAKPKGKHSDGYHWVCTKGEIVLMPEPMTFETHEKLTELIFTPFHENVKKHYRQFKEQGFKDVFHLDLHSMPSLGTNMHKDPGEYRADIVISDCVGKSCSTEYKDLVIEAYLRAGFSINYNWPYMGGRVTEQYGKPEEGQHAIQVELNRALYMDERTKKLIPKHVDVQEKLFKAISYIKSELHKIKI